MNALQDWFNGERANLVWIDYTDYATRIIGGGKAWDNAQAIAGVLLQGQGLLNSDVITIDAGKILFENCTSEDEALTKLQSTLSDDSRLRMLADTIDAVAHASQAALALRLPGLHDALRRCGADEEYSLDFGNLDDAGAAYTDVIRHVAEKPLAGIVFSFDGPCSDDEIEALEPVCAAAEHYDWLVAAEYLNASEPPPNPIGALSLLAEATQSLTEDGNKIGGGLSTAFWQAQATPTELNLCYGRIPADAVPETVLTQRGTITA